MQRRLPIRPPALAAVVLAALISTLLVAAGASAGPLLSRKQADAVAIRVFRPQADKGEVILFGLPKPLPRGTLVVPADPPNGAPGKKARVRARRLTAAAWLYWLDRDPYSRFSHDSEYLLVDDRTGRVVERKRIGWFPTINAKDPAFLSERGYESQRYRVFARVDAVRSRSAAVSRRIAADADLPPGAFANDCLLMFGDYHDAATRNDFPAVEQLAGSFGLRSFYATPGGPKSAPQGEPPSADDLKANVKTLVDVQRCQDILVYMSGHGIREGRGPPSVMSGKRVRPLPTAPFVEVQHVGVTAEELEQIVNAHPKTTFKVKIDSCFSGRFLEELTVDGKLPQENLLIVEVSSQANRVSQSRGDSRTPYPQRLGTFTRQNLVGLKTWAASDEEVASSLALGGSLLAHALERGFMLGRSANRSIRTKGIVPQIVRGETGDPVKVAVNTFGLGSEFKGPWIPAWVDNGTSKGAIVFTDRPGNQIGALEPTTGRADRFPLRAITNPNGIAAIDPFRFAVAGNDGVAIFDRTPPGRITELVLPGSRLVNLARGPTGNLYVTNIADNSFVTIRPPYAGPADVTRTPLPPVCLRPTGIVPTASGLTVLCQQTNNIVFLDASGGLTRSVALPTPNIGAQEPKPTGSSGIVFSGFGSNRVYRYRNNGLQSAETGRGPAVPTIAYYPDDYDDLFAKQTTDDYAFVPHFTAGGATVAEFNRDGESEQLSILSSRNLVGSSIGPGCSPWVADATPGGPGLHRVRFSVPGAPTRPRSVGANLHELPVRCTDFTDATRTHAVTARIPNAWTRAGRVEFGIVGYRGDPWGAKATFLANFPLELGVRATGGGSGSPRVTLRQTGAYTAVASVTRIPARSSTVTMTITSKGTPAPFGLLTAARVRR